MKRFTDSDKWKDQWFRRLPPKLKCLWSYLCDTCDHAGVFEFDPETAGFFIGEEICQNDLTVFGDRIKPVRNGRFIISKFINFQYGKLSKDCKPHAPVFTALRKHGIEPEEICQGEDFSNYVSPEIRKKVIERDGMKCVYSEKPLMPWDIEIDHVVPRSKGGTNDLSNLVVADKSMNSLKSDLDLKAFCCKAGLDYEIVCQRILKAINGHSIPTDRVLNTLQDKDKDKDSTKDKDQKGESEGKRMPLRLHGIPSSPEEVIAYGATLNPRVPPQTCRDFFAHYEGQARINQNGQLFWITGSSNETIITNWRAKLPSFGGIRSHANNRQSGQQGISASRGTANEGTASGYANARAIRKPLEATTQPVPNVPRPGVGGNGQGHDGVCNVDPLTPS